MNKKEKAYVDQHADKVEAHILKLAARLTGKSCKMLWFWGNRIGLPSVSEAADMGDVLRQTIAPRIKNQGIYLKSQWDDEDGGWGILISRIPFQTERDLGLGTLMLDTLEEMEKKGELPLGADALRNPGAKK